MQRREVLALTAGALPLLAGCQTSLGATDDAPTIESRHVERTRSRCVPERRTDHEIAATYDSDATELRFSGALVADHPCVDPAITAETGRGRQQYRDDSYHISVDTPRIGDCAPCSAQVNYSATVEFDEDPGTIYLYHVEPNADEWIRVGPLTTVSPT